MKIIKILFWLFLYFLVLIVGSDNAVLTGRLLTVLLFIYCLYCLIWENYFNIFALLCVFPIVGLNVRFIDFLPFFRFEDTIGFLILPLALIFKSVDNLRENYDYKFVTLVFSFTVVIVISCFWGYVTKLSVFSPRDFTALFLQVKWGMIILFAHRINWNQEKIENLVLTLLITFGLSALVGILQGFGVEFSIVLGKSFWAHAHHAENLHLGGRVTGTAFGPPQYATLLIIAITFTVSVIIFMSNWIRFLAYLVFNMTVLALFFSGSRGGIISVGFIILLTLIIAWNRIPIVLKFSYGIFSVVSLIFLIMNFFYYSSYLSDFVHIIRNPMDEVTIIGRLKQLRQAAELFLVSPIFGYGPHKYKNFGATHMEWYYVATRYGIFGLIWLIAFYQKTISIGLTLFRQKQSENKLFEMVGLIIILSFAGLLVYNFNGLTFSRIQTPNLFFPLLAIGLSLINQHLQSDNNTI